MKKSLISISLSAPVLSLLLSFSAVVPARAAEDVPQSGYTTQTLQSPIFNASEVVVETEQLTRWLDENYDSLNSRQTGSMREHLYYLIDSRVKELYSQSSVVLPTAPDPLLESLFAWAEPLGVYGGNLAYSAVNSAGSADRSSTLEVPATMALSLEEDLFTVRSDAWQFEVPYYFMITGLREFSLPTGIPAQGVFLSTGATEDSTELGHSQATLVYLFAPGAQASDFENVRESFEISDRAEARSLDNLNQNSYYELDSEGGLDLHKEITTWEDESGAYAVIYLGADGTYQWNRPHFLDFLASIKSN